MFVDRKFFIIQSMLELDPEEHFCRMNTLAITGFGNSVGRANVSEVKDRVGHGRRRRSDLEGISRMKQKKGRERRLADVSVRARISARPIPSLYVQGASTDLTDESTLDPENITIARAARRNRASR
jgi:hypothetical protein